MNNGLTYETVIELLPAYALDALEPDEMVAVEDYLAQQRALLARVDQLQDVTAQLAHAAPTASVSPTVKATLMAQVRAGAKSTLRSSATHRSDAKPSADGAPAQSTRNPLLAARSQERNTPFARAQQVRPIQPPLPAPRPPQRFNFGWLAAAAIAVAALFIIWVDIGVQRQLGQLQTVLAERTTQVTDLSQQVQILEEQLQQDQLHLAFFTGPSEIATLTGTPSAPNAAGVYYQQNGEALVVLHGLEPLPTTQTYQLWLIPAEGNPAPAGLLPIHTAATVDVQFVTLPTAALDYATVGITVEPATGSEQPTSDPVLVGEKT